MLINPNAAIANGWITHPDCKNESDWTDRSFISPNAIDFPIDRLFTINQSKAFIISETFKSMRGGKEIIACQHTDKKGQLYWYLDPNSTYDAMSNMYVEVPDDVAVTLIIRSTFNRNGIFITSGIYDTGFSGNIGMAIHNRSGEAFIAPSTRIGQIMFWTADSSGKYAGQYNTEKGAHWND